MIKKKQDQLPHQKNDQPKQGIVRPARYQRPVLQRWGTLRELTEGGGGRKREPGRGGRFTRF